MRPKYFSFILFWVFNILSFPRIKLLMHKFMFLYLVLMLKIMSFHRFRHLFCIFKLLQYFPLILTFEFNWRCHDALGYSWMMMD